MIPLADLLTIANGRLDDAQSLLDAGRYDGAAYMCGYSVEIALKHKICLTLNWTGFPSTNREFDNYKSLKTHDLDVLLSFTGIETSLKSTNLAEWSAIAIWNPEARYGPVGAVTAAEATLMISSARTLIALL